MIGNPNTRKSAVLRSLSGCFNRSVRDIQLTRSTSPLRVYARAGALQMGGTTPAEAVAEVAAKRCDAALLCLWPSAHPHDATAYPEATAYLAHFEAAGWRLRAIAVLGQNTGGVRGANVRQFAMASAQPINVTAHAVRGYFGWV